MMRYLARQFFCVECAYLGPDQVQLTISEIVSKKTDNLSCHLQYNAL